MDQGAVQEIAKLAQLHASDRVTILNGEDYSSQQLHHIKTYEPAAASVIVSTLGSFIDLIMLNIDGLELKEHYIEVMSHKEVRLAGKIDRKDKVRLYPYVAMLEDLPGFPYSHFMSVESFLIALGTQFVINDDLGKLMAYASKVTNEESIQLEDDGITQKAVVKTGVSGAMKEVAVAMRTVSLQPYRTFREVTQVPSPFLFRMRNGREGVECALFEADGGTWKIAQVEAIQSWIQDEIPKPEGEERLAVIA